MDLEDEAAHVVRHARRAGHEAQHIGAPAQQGSAVARLLGLALLVARPAPGDGGLGSAQGLAILRAGAARLSCPHRRRPLRSPAHDALLI